MLVIDFLVERKAFRPRLFGDEIGRMGKKKRVKIGKREWREIWGGGVLTHQNPISLIWKENLGGFISTQSITFLPLFL